jgi:hypothetical protein
VGGFNAFNQQSVNDNGGVAWAKQVAQSMDPGAVESQVHAYQQAANKLAEAQTGPRWLIHMGRLFLAWCAWDSSGRCREGRGRVGVPGVVVAEGVV